MTAGAPWSVKGIDPKAREIAKDLARRSGMTLGEWLNHMIVEGEAPDAEAFAEDSTVISHPRDDAPPRYEAVHHPADEVGKVTEAIERLTARIEAAEQRSTLAITGIDQSVRGALSRLEGAEREQISVAARFEGAVDELRTEQARATERLRRVEAEAVGPRSVEALRALEGSVGKVANQVYDTEARSREAIAALEAKVAAGGTPDAAALADEVAARVLGRLETAEAQTTEAVRDLGLSFVKLDARLRKVEGADNTAALQTLSHSLNSRLERVRQEMAESLRRASDGGFGRVEQKLSEMTAHVHAAEQRSAMAIERMGREMVSMADNLSRRVQSVEGRSAQAVEHVGSEVSRIAGLVEQRLAHNDGSQAQALERLGAEIARITERLSERIANSERRSAQAIDDVGEQVARVTERISQRQERVSTDLAERIRQSEERTARLLDEAREKIDASMTTATRRIADQVAQAPAPPAARWAEPAMDPFAPDPFPTRGQAIPEDTFEPRAFGARSTGPAEPGFDTPKFESDDFPVRSDSSPAFSESDFEEADGFEPVDDFQSDSFAPLHDEDDEVDAAPAPVFDADLNRALSTREVIEQARAAARTSGSPEAKPARKGGLFGARPKATKKKAGSALTTALGITALLACGGLVAAGMILNTPGGGEMAERISRGLQIQEADGKEIMTAEADTTPGLKTEPRVSMAIAPDMAGATTAPATPTIATPPAGPATAADLFKDAVKRVEARDPSGLADLRKAANQGHAPAQFYLAKLYENGEGGVAKDLGQARQWTERAAQAGDRRAMHNLGLFYFEGQGGAKNLTTAAQWFRRAADLGLTDSQYNLGMIYEEGFGVTQNNAEAYKWYLIAGKGGDAEARNSAERIRTALSPEARSGAERAAGGYRAAAPNPSAAPSKLAGGPSVGSAAQAQRALSRLGYYQGPQDSKASPALEGAIRAYQRDQGLAITGQMDAQTTARLAIYAQ